MKFIQGENREQTFLFPVSLDDAVDAENEVRLIDVFVDSLRAIAPESYVGSAVFNEAIIDEMSLSPIQLSDQTGYDTLWNSIENSANFPQLRKILRTLDTYQGAALTASLDMLLELKDTESGMKQHIIMITDDGWYIEDDITPEDLLERYRPQFPDGEFPQIHTVLLSDAGNPSENGVDGLDNLVMITDSTGGLYIENARPETIIATLIEIITCISTAVTPANSKTTSMGTFPMLTFGATGDFHISLLPTGGGKTTVLLYDFSGRLLFDKTIGNITASNQLTVPANSIPPTPFVIKISDGNGNWVRRTALPVR